MVSENESLTDANFKFSLPFYFELIPQPNFAICFWYIREVNMVYIFPPLSNISLLNLGILNKSTRSSGLFC